MGCGLRPVRADDRAFLLRLYTQVREDLAALPLPGAARQQLIAQQFDAQAAGYAADWPGHDHDIVTLDGAPVGQLRLHRGATRLHGVDVSLLASARGQGIGTWILQGMQAEARARGVPLRLSVAQGNPAARRLYLRMGFVPVEDLGTHLAMDWRVSSG